MSERTIAQRVLRIEGLLGLQPDLSFAQGSEFWIVQGEGDTDDRSLAYWGPYETAEAAATDFVFKADRNHVIVEVPL
jgi:hypothetical protein